MLSARRHQGWRVFTALRPVISVLLVVLMAGNAVSGSFSGFAHAHDSDHIGHHYHHDDGEDHHHHDDDHRDGYATLPAADTGEPAISDTNREAEQGQIHVHGPVVTLGLAKVVAWEPKPIRPAWNPPSPDQLVSDHQIPSERPPRAA